MVIFLQMLTAFGKRKPSLALFPKEITLG